MTLKQFFGNSNVLLSLVAINIGIALLLGLISLFSAPVGIGIQSALVMPAPFRAFILQPWSLLTYMFTQISFLHLLFNMLWLLWFGRIFLYCSDGKRLLLTYLGGGVVGGIFFLLVSLGHPAPSGFLIGASAAVLSVMTAASIMAPNLELRLLLLGEIRLKYVALLCIVLTFLGIGGGNTGGFSAHFGGVIFGLFAPSLLGSSSRISFNWLNNIFGKLKKKLSVRRRKVPDILLTPGEAPRQRGSRHNRDKISDEERLDQLLDKIRVSGYNSLSSSEKRELNDISSKL